MEIKINNNVKTGFIIRAKLDDPFLLHPNQTTKVNTNLDFKLSLTNKTNDSVCIYENMELAELIFNQKPVINLNDQVECSVQ